MVISRFYTNTTPLSSNSIKPDRTAQELLEIIEAGNGAQIPDEELIRVITKGSEDQSLNAQQIRELSGARKDDYDTRATGRYDSMGSNRESQNRQISAPVNTETKSVPLGNSDQSLTDGGVPEN